MSVIRIPILVWRDHSDLYTASVVEQPYTAAVGDSARACLTQLRHHLTWVQRNEPWNFPDDEMKKQELVKVSVDVRPEYLVGMRHHPVSHSMKLGVPCVHGETEFGLRVCSIPPLNIWFSYHDPKRLKELAVHYVRDRLKGSAPHEIRRYMNAAEYELEEVLVPEPRYKQSHGKASHPELEEVAEPLGERSLRKQYSRAWEREDEIGNLVRRLKQDRANVLLVGEPGVGKTSILASAVREIERSLENVDEKRLFWITGGSHLIAGTPFLGQWEERLEKVIAQLADINGALCIENLLELVRLGGHGATDSVGAFLVPYMKHSELQVVAEVTPNELDACRRLLPGLADAFQILHVEEFPPASAVNVLDRIVADGARNLRVEAGNEIVQSIFRLFHRYRPYDVFPGKASVFTTTLLKKAATTEEARVTTDDVLTRFMDDSGLPEKFLRDEIALPQSEILAYLQSRVIGQPGACQAAADIVTTFKAGLNAPKRPLGVLLFSGPTGVGKTELSRALSDYLFGHGQVRDRLVRLDMSEYSGHGASERLVSDANGNPSEFVKKVRTQPFCVVLFDEIEKASPDVFDMLLGVFDEGRLTDRFGRVTTFQSAVLIMTSNLGAGRDDTLGFGEGTGTDYDAEVMKFFRPEFYNRIDGVVAFEPLKEETIREIAEKELNELTRREGIAKAGLSLEWTPEVRNRLAEAGFDRRYGARPLQRALEELVVTPLARLIAEDPKIRDCKILLGVGDSGQIVLSTN